MKKKALALVVVIAVIGIGAIIIGSNYLAQNKEENKDLKNTDFDKYTGIYEYKNNTIKVFHNNNKLKFYIYNKNNTQVENSSGILDGNKVNNKKYAISFTNTSLKLNSKNKDIPSGVYEKTKKYETDDIYKDFIGDIELIDKYSGHYQKDEITLDTILINNESLKIYYKKQKNVVSITLNKVDNNKYQNKVFDNTYEITFDDNSVQLTITDKDKNIKEESGKYTKKNTLSKVDIIKEFNE